MHAPNALTTAQREAYFETGFLCAEGLIPDAWLQRLNALSDAFIEESRAADLVGKAGTVIAINCRTLHASRANATARVRPVALFVYSSADAFAWMPAPTPTSHTGDIVRGSPATMAHLDPFPCPVPPDWSKLGYGSIFVAQKAEM